MKQWESMRRSAKSLYCAICAGWLCQCRQAHSAHLRLEDNTSGDKHHRFNIAFSYGLSSTNAAPASWTWQETEVESGEEDEEETTPSLASRTPKVAFQQAAATQTTSSTNQQQISCLCNALQQNENLKTGPSCLGYISGTQRKHYVHLVRSPSNNGKLISLYELLSSNGNISSPVSLTISLHDRLGPAVLLASSLLQLQSASPSWLKSRWTSQDIQFIPSTSGVLLYSCAYVCQPFSSRKDTGRPRSAPGNGISVREIAIRNEAVFSLGVTLIELSINTTLESVQTDSERARSDLSDLCTARRIAEETKRDNLDDWNIVIDRCLRCGFQASPDFEDKTFRQEFYHSVVAPLRDLYGYVKPRHGIN